MLARNADRLAARGTLVPRAGRSISYLGPNIAGHHNIGFELLHHPAFRASDGSLDDLRNELASSACSRAVVSSEALSLARDVPGALERLRADVAASGFEPVIVIYLRGQATFARSLYTMFVTTRQCTIDFRTFCDGILDHRGLHDGERFISFAYDRLLEPFETIFGREQIVVRPFAAKADPKTIMRDFLHVLDGHASDETRFASSAPLNTGGSLGSVMAALYANLSASRSHLVNPDRIASDLGTSRAALEQPFDPRDETIARLFDEAFSGSNREIRNRYGIEIVTERLPAGDSAAEQAAFVAACTARWGVAS
jgi:hypothetical protein